jgi:hypothetical protein
VRHCGTLFYTRVRAAGDQATVSPQRAYLGKAVLFSLNGRWPLHARQRPAKARGWDATTKKQPDPPPAGMSEAELARARQLLQCGGWDLVEVQGVWKPVKMIG